MINTFFFMIFNLCCHWATIEFVRYPVHILYAYKCTRPVYIDEIHPIDPATYPLKAFVEKSIL